MKKIILIAALLSLPLMGCASNRAVHERIEAFEASIEAAKLNGPAKTDQALKIKKEARDKCLAKYNNARGGAEPYCEGIQVYHTENGYVVEHIIDHTKINKEFKEGQSK